MRATATTTAATTATTTNTIDNSKQSGTQTFSSFSLTVSTIFHPSAAVTTTTTTTMKCGGVREGVAVGGGAGAMGNDAKPNKQLHGRRAKIQLLQVNVVVVIVVVVVIIIVIRCCC